MDKFVTSIFHGIREVKIKRDHSRCQIELWGDNGDHPYVIADLPPHLLIHVEDHPGFEKKVVNRYEVAKLADVMTLTSTLKRQLRD